jgi:hypothetical protein
VQGDNGSDFRLIVGIHKLSRFRSTSGIGLDDYSIRQAKVGTMLIACWNKERSIRSWLRELSIEK